MDSLRKSTLSEVPMGAVLAFVIAGSGVAFAGIGAAFWALIGGVAVSVLLERPAIRTIWRTA
jgi:predicted benzoate:H+ symporter BenE